MTSEPDYSCGPVFKFPPMIVYDPPRPPADNGGFSSAEEQSGWETASDEAWESIDEAEDSLSND